MHARVTKIAGQNQVLFCRKSETLDIKRAGVLVGSAFGGINSFASGCATLMTNHKKMNPFCIPFAITNMGSAMLAMDTGLMGPNYSVSSACATGNYCMLNAVNHIRAGEADIMLAGATDAAIIPEGVCYTLCCTNQELHAHRQSLATNFA